MKAATMCRAYLREAAVMLVAARLAVRFVPAPRLFAWANRPPRRIRRFALDQVPWVSWAIDTIGAKPWMKALCLPRALATQAMLRRRGIASRLCLGVAREDGVLAAHAWVEIGQDSDQIATTRAERAASASCWAAPRASPAWPHSAARADEARTLRMSGIAGLLRFDGQPVERRDLERMANALQAHGPDRSDVLLADNVGLVHVLMRMTPEDQFDRQPWRGASGAIIAADLRLDNRDDVLGRIGMAPQDALAWPDSRVLLTAWEKLGDEIWATLRGPFAVAIWDQRDRTLTLARDQLGLNVVMCRTRARASSPSPPCRRDCSRCPMCRAS